MANVGTKDFKVAIVGGGMCGLVCAVGLKNAGISVDIYEAAPKFGEIGAGVGLGPNAIRVLEELDILDAVVAKSDQQKPAVRPFKFISGLGDHEEFYVYPVGPEDVGLGVHRAAFLDALVHLVDRNDTHFDKRCVSIRNSLIAKGKLDLLFADGSTARADVVLGADGIRSVVRSYVVLADQKNQSDQPTPGEAAGLVRTTFTNTIAYRGLVSNAKLNGMAVKTDMSETPICWTGPGKHIITFPIRGGEIINVVAFACDRSICPGERPLPPGQPWVNPRSTEELLAEYDGWGEDVRKLLQCMTSPSVWSIHAVQPPLDEYVKGRVALVGDAAHGMLPHLGAGAGQGLEDVLILVKLLSHPSTTSASIEALLEVYDTIRRPRANDVLLASAMSGEIYEGFGPSGPTMEGMRRDLVGIWDKVWHHDLSKDYDKAVGILKAKGVF